MGMDNRTEEDMTPIKRPADFVEELGKEHITEPQQQASVLTIRGLCRNFGKVTAVDGLDLDVKEGEIYGFLGVNGAGKTTTIRMIMGILSIDSGAIELFGESHARTTIAQKQKIGFLSQEQNIYPWMTAKIVGKFVSGLYPDWNQQEYLRLLEIFEIPLDRKFSALSGGMKMKLALALAVAPNPKILILDEPTAGMDPVARREFLHIIKRQSQHSGRTVFFSSHLLDEVEYIADRVGIIHKGQMKFEGKLSLLRERVRLVVADEGFVVPEGFELWSKDIDDARPADSTEVRYVLNADPAIWATSGLNSQALSLNDIFIACVTISAMEL